MLYLAYDNKALPDGAGAQLQRILCIYLIAKAYGLGYVHVGLGKLSYQGAKCLEENKEDPGQIDRYNELFSLPSDTMSSTMNIYEVYYITEEIIQRFRDEPGNTLLLVQLAGAIVDKNPGLLAMGCNVLPWTIRPVIYGRPVVVAVHVRRGELFVVDSDRMLPNSYYVDCMKALADVFGRLGITYEFHVHTEVVEKAVVVTGETHGICGRIQGTVELRPGDNHLEDFSVIPGIVWHINEYPVNTLKALALADVLLASRSSFSYVAAILKCRGAVLFHPFWHSLAPGWIPTRGPKDVYDSADKILAGLMV
jgi:hypothetical protein